MIQVQYKKVSNKLFFRDIHKRSYLNIQIQDDTIWIEMLKVEIEFRGAKLATCLLQKVIDFLKIHQFKSIKLNILPIDNQGLNLTQLKSFYEKFGFKTLHSSNLAYKNMMELKL